MGTAKEIEVLNSLIIINNDRIEGYKTASEETEESDLKDLFAEFISTSKECKDELSREVITLGGKVEEGTTVSGKFFSVWMDVKAALTGKERKAILNSCEYGEDEAQATYEKVLEDDSEHWNSQQLTMFDAQKTSLKADHDFIKSLRDAFI